MFALYLIKCTIRRVTSLALLFVVHNVLRASKLLYRAFSCQYPWVAKLSQLERQENVAVGRAGGQYDRS